MTYIIIIIVSVFVLFIVRKIVINRRNKKLILTVTSLDRGTSSEKDLILILLEVQEMEDIEEMDYYLL